MKTRIKELRTQLGLTQQQLADLDGLGVGTDGGGGLISMNDLLHSGNLLFSHKIVGAMA